MMVCQTYNDRWCKQIPVTIWLSKVTCSFVLLLFLNLLFVLPAESAGTLMNSNGVSGGEHDISSVADAQKRLASGKIKAVDSAPWSETASSSPFGSSQKGTGKMMDSQRSLGNDVSYMQIVKTLFALGLVICVILGSLYVIKAMMGRGVGSRGDGGLVEVLATSFVGPKKAISIVRVAGEHLVLGITHSEISFLSKIESPEAIQLIESHKIAGSVPFVKIFEKVRAIAKKG